MRPLNFIHRISFLFTCVKNPLKPIKSIFTVYLFQKEIDEEAYSTNSPEGNTMPHVLCGVGRFLDYFKQIDDKKGNGHFS